MMVRFLPCRALGEKERSKEGKKGNICRSRTTGNLPAIIREEKDTIESMPSYDDEEALCIAYFARSAADPSATATVLLKSSDLPSRAKTSLVADMVSPNGMILDDS